MTRVQDAGIVWVASVAFFLAGLTTAFFFNFEIPLVSFSIFPAIDLLLLGLAVLVFSMLFFGRLTPLFFFLVGASQVSLLRTVPIVLVFHSVPLFLMGFVGTLFGMRLLDDLNGSDNIFEYKKELLFWFAVSAIVAIAIGFFDPQLVGINSVVMGFIG